MTGSSHLLAGFTLATLLLSLPVLIGLGTPSQLEEVTIKAEPVYQGLSFPVSIAFAPDGRIFFNELKEGKIRIIKDGNILEEPFAELKVVTLAETGLLGLALHPNFKDEPYVYVYHTYSSEDGTIHNRVVRFMDSNDKGVKMEVIIDRIPAASIHNGGRLAFGPDGKLYITTGDANRRELSQDPNSLAGKNAVCLH